MFSAGQRRVHSGGPTRVRRGYSLVRLRLDQLLDDEPVLAEERHPLAVRDLVVAEALVVLDHAHAEVRLLQRLGELVRRGVDAHDVDGARRREHEDAAGLEDASGLGDGEEGIDERRRAVVGEDDVEALVTKRRQVCGGLDERHVLAVLRDVLASMVELAPGDVETDREGADLGERGRTARRRSRTRARACR